MLFAARLAVRLHRSPFFLYRPLSYTSTSMESSKDALQKEIEQQTLFVNDLRKQNATPAIIDEAKKKLGDLKKSLALSKGTYVAKDAGGKKRERLMLKTAKVRLHLHHLLGIV